MPDTAFTEAFKQRAAPEAAQPQEYSTPLTPEDEQQFEAWRKSLPTNLQDDSDYDLRGAWKADAKAAANGHLPDTFKKPNHPTFSNESIYSTPQAPGGEWEQDKNGHWSFVPSAVNLRTFGADGLRRYFQEREPDAKLVLPDQ